MIQPAPDPQVVTDENNQPVAVVMSYERWLKLSTDGGADGSRARDEIIRRPADQSGDVNRFHGRIPGLEDGVGYQRRLRDEWA